MVDIEKQIISGSKKTHKTYSFDEKHNSNLPVEKWFQESPEGLVLFTVFYTQACRWSKCLGCNLPSKTSLHHVSYKNIKNQIDHIFDDEEVKEKAKDIKKLIISNNGSVLDEETFSSNALMYLITHANLHFPNLAIMSMETRPEYVDTAELEFIARALKEGDTPTNLELSIGFEAFDEKIRNDDFQKGLSLDIFEKFIKKIAPYKFQVKCYFMQKPVPNMDDQAAVEDIQNAIDYLSGIAEKYDVHINMHLNPTYVAYGTDLEKHFFKGTYNPPRLNDVVKAAAHAKGKNLSIFLGLYDEGLAVEGGSFIREGEESLIEKLEHFNKTLDFGILHSVMEAS